MQRYFAENKIDNKFILSDSDIHHIKNVMRMDENGEIEVVYDTIPYLCSIHNIKNNMEVILKKELKKLVDTIPQVNLIIPLLKEQKMDLILQKATELGVYEITPIYTENSIIKIDSQKEEKKLIRWLKICKEASEQSFRDTIPIINKIQNIDDLKVNDLNLICSTREKSNYIKNVLKKDSNCDKINVVIGPEGGLSPKEEDKFIKMGYLPITLGNRIMRVETVPLFILSIINYEFMR